MTWKPTHYHVPSKTLFRVLYEKVYVSNGLSMNSVYTVYDNENGTVYSRPHTDFHDPGWFILHQEYVPPKNGDIHCQSPMGD